MLFMFAVIHMCICMAANTLESDVSSAANVYILALAKRVLYLSADTRPTEAERETAVWVYSQLG